jgi:SP family xylose:H+ symportor-like MFS transporter
MQNKQFLYQITIVATLGGLLFGYDTAVISGAISNLAEYFSLSPAQKGWAASSALVGCIAGAILASYLSISIGRKRGMIVASILFFISALGSGLADNFTIFIIYRIVGGVGVGLASMLAPMYIAEISPASQRGLLVSLYQLAIVTGIIVVYFVNYIIALQGDAQWNLNLGWRWMFASEAIPSLLYFAFLFLVPQSPRWQAMKGYNEKAKNTLNKINGEALADDIFREIQEELKQERGTLKDLLTPAMKLALTIGLGLSIFQQITGINAIMYYAPEIFRSFGSSGDTALLQTILVGTVNLIFTIVAIYSIDKLGRKPLLLWGMMGMGICLFIVGFGLYIQSTGIWLLFFMLGFVACFAVSWGPAVWVLLSEIFPNKVRGVAMSITVFIQWTANFAVSQTFPMMVENEALKESLHGAFPFWFYGTMSIFAVIFVWRMVPETKQKTLEEMTELWESMVKK